MYKFDLLEYPICLSLPRRTVPFMSWRQHIPFAMLLVDLIKPKMLVELGVHHGDSYCAFCQAVADLELKTVCYGVDTWKGDPHASFYDSEVLRDLVAHHDPLYGSFSHLMQSTFDEALQHFKDGTIDLLHIDGYHTYEAVKHDFETWLPKMSPRGVVLIHDISEKKDDFGAWKVWDEIKTKYPHFTFVHCHGLGVVAVGQMPPEELGWLFEASDEKATAIRDFFSSLGERLTDKVSSSVGKEADSSAVVELYAIRSSITWRASMKLHSFIDSVVLPFGSRRRFLAVRLLRWILHAKTEIGFSMTKPPDRRKELARKYIRGTGVVIGSVPSYLQMPANVMVDYADVTASEKLSGGYSDAAKGRVTGKHMHNRITKLAEASDESYDFSIGQLTVNSVENINNCLRVLKPGGIVYLSVPVADSSRNVLSDLQSAGGSNIRILDTATNLMDNTKQDIYIIEKADYVHRIIGIIQKNPKIVSSDNDLVDVIVPIYNAYEELERCLYSLFRHQDNYRIMMINDCSTDTRVAVLLDILKRHSCERFTITENEANTGYLQTVNRGMRMTRGDVILLNSDTIVTSGWASKMRACAYSCDRIATVTPFTNSGTVCSIPAFGNSNEIPEGFTTDSFAELVENVSLKRYPELITAVGFCMYIRRAIIDEIGYYDEENFGKGYGEENDFSVRAIRRGYKNVLCDNTFVFHKMGSSFITERDSLIAKSSVTLSKMYPEFWSAIDRFYQLNPLKEFQDNIKKEIKKVNIRAGDR